MRKQQWVLLMILIIIFVGIVVSAIVFSQQSKEIEVNIVDVNHNNSQYFLNVSVVNHQDRRGWIDDMYLSTLQGSEIDITGAGVGYLIEPGETKELTLWSSEVQISLTDPPFTFTYTAFPSGKQYRIYI
jgi:hypothetical protein